MAIPKNLARCTGHRVAAAVAALAIAVALPAAAQPKTDSKPTDSKPTDAHRRDDVTRHRAIAAAHEAAARCLESGQKESTCHEALRKACEGLAVGRYCGMKHVH